VLRLLAFVLRGVRSLVGFWWLFSLRFLLRVRLLGLLLVGCLGGSSRRALLLWLFGALAFGGACRFPCCLVAFGWLLIRALAFGFGSSSLGLCAPFFCECDRFPPPSLINPIKYLEELSG